MILSDAREVMATVSARFHDTQKKNRWKIKELNIKEYTIQALVFIMARY